MKCKNCGAELNNGKCEYCGSKFLEHTLFLKGNCDKDDDSRMIKTLITDRIEVTCLGDEEPHFIEGYSYV